MRRSKAAWVVVSPDGFAIYGRNLRTHRAAKRVCQRLRQRYGIDAYLASMTVSVGAILRS